MEFNIPSNAQQQHLQTSFRTETYQIVSIRIVVTKVIKRKDR